MTHLLVVGIVVLASVVFALVALVGGALVVTQFAALFLGKRRVVLARSRPVALRPLRSNA